MPELIVWTKVAHADKFRRLAERLKRAGRGDLQRRLTAAVRREGQPALQAVRAAWGGVDVTSPKGGGYSSGLRARVAAATTIVVRAAGIRVRVKSSQVDPKYGRTLVHGLNALHHWSHPVFGNRNAWSQQYGQEVFFSTLYDFEGAWRDGVEDEMQQVTREIAG